MDRSKIEGAMIESCGLSILYVEDEADARELIARMVRTKYPGATMHLAADGKEGLDLFWRHRPDLLITDLNMPLLDGLALAREVKSADPDLFIIAVTASSETRSLLESIEIGINSYVLKPVDYNHLWRGIDRCIELKVLKQQVALQDEHIRTLSRAVEESPSAVIITDAAGAVEYANPCFCRLTGFEPEEVRGKSLQFLQTSGTSPESPGPWSSFASRQEWRGEYLCQARDGEFFWASASSSPIYDAGGNLTHFVIIQEDITERKVVENNLHERKLRFRELYNRAPVLLASIDRTGRITDVNDQWLECLGYVRDEVVGRKIYDFVIASSPLFINDIAIPEFFQEGTGSMPLQFLKKGGEGADFLISTRIKRNDLGEITRSLVAMTPLSDPLPAPKEREEWYRCFFEHFREGLVITSWDGKIVDANAEACRILGKSRDELSSNTGSELFCDGEEMGTAPERMNDVPLRGAFRVMRKDGSIVPVEVHATPYRGKDGQRFSTLVIHEATDQHRRDAKGHTAQALGTSSDTLFSA